MMRTTPTIAAIALLCGTGRMNYLDILLGSIALVGVVWMSSVILAARQRQACARLLFLAVIDGICGLTNLVLGAGHLTAVVVRALTVEAAHSYDFRRYSLVMVGFLTCAGGLICLLNVGGLLKHSNCAWKNALWASALLVTVNAPLIPLQSFAVLLTSVSVTNVIGLLWVQQFLRQEGKPCGPGQSDMRG
jgi:hypothetical protein